MKHRLWRGRSHKSEPAAAREGPGRAGLSLRSGGVHHAHGWLFSTHCTSVQRVEFGTGRCAYRGAARPVLLFVSRCTAAGTPWGWDHLS